MTSKLILNIFKTLFQMNFCLLIRPFLFVQHVDVSRIKEASTYHNLPRNLHFDHLRVVHIKYLHEQYIEFLLCLTLFSQLGNFINHLLDPDLSDLYANVTKFV